METDSDEGDEEVLNSEEDDYVEEEEDVSTSGEIEEDEEGEEGGDDGGEETEETEKKVTIKRAKTAYQIFSSVVAGITRHELLYTCHPACISPPLSFN